MTKQANNPVDYHKMESFFSNKNLFQFIWKWRMVFSITFILAALLSGIFSGPKFITPKFKSDAIVYPVNLSEYADESFTEQMLQLFQSTELKLKLIEAFDLYRHYKIDPDAQYAQTYIFDELSDHISFSKTSYESVRIQVLDKDPQIAAAMVDSINSFYNHLAKSIQNIKIRERIERDQKEMTKIKEENDSLVVRLKTIRKQYNIINPLKQTKEVTKAYLKNSPGADALYKNLLEYKDDIIFLDSLVLFNNGRYIEYKDDYDEQLTELNRNIRFSSVISKPIPADKKSYPVRWLIMTATVIASLIFCFIVLIVLESLQRNKTN